MSFNLRNLSIVLPLRDIICFHLWYLIIFLLLREIIIFHLRILRGPLREPILTLRDPIRPLRDPILLPTTDHRLLPQKTIILLNLREIIIIQFHLDHRQHHCLEADHGNSLPLPLTLIDLFFLIQKETLSHLNKLLFTRLIQKETLSPLNNLLFTRLIQKETLSPLISLLFSLSIQVKTTLPLLSQCLMFALFELEKT